LQSDIIIALPGGIGTLDEVFTVAAAHTIGYHSKKVVLYNMKGFWNKLIETLDKLETDGFIRGNWHDYIFVADSLEDIKRFASEAIE
jgi:predicted Rossmann-fold nucleotide-binding protein